MIDKLLSIEIPKEEHGSRIDRCIRRLLGNINQSILEKYLRSGSILLEKKKIKSSFKVSVGQLIEYSSHIDFENKIIKEYINEDRYKYYQKLYNKILIKKTNEYIAINKPSGLAVQGGSSQKFHIDDMLKYVFKDQTIPKLVHRIDKDTSGLLLIANDQIIAKKLSIFFKEQKIIKTYLALVSPSPKIDSGFINLPVLKKGGEGNQRMKIDYDKGKVSQTDV